MRLFADAQIVAGSHGAGFSNLIFTPPGSRALIVEKDFALFLGPARLFESLAVAMGRGHDHVPATSIFEDGTDYGVFVNRHFADAVVDPAAFAAALDRTVAASEAETASSPIGA